MMILRMPVRSEGDEVFDYDGFKSFDRKSMLYLYAGLCDAMIAGFNLRIPMPANLWLRQVLRV